MLAALTGTPGTGKSTIGIELQGKGFNVLEVNELAKRHGLLRSKDLLRDSYELDMDEVQAALESEGFTDGVLVGHLSHLLRVDVIIVLRCHPSVLASRLEARGWPSMKVRENASAEALDIILAESMESDAEVSELDTTDIGLDDAVAAVLSILDGEKEKYAVGNIDWSEEALKWS